MQLLLGDKLGQGTDANSFLQELFLQRLPPNVRMVLATTLENLADIIIIIIIIITALQHICISR